MHYIVEDIEFDFEDSQGTIDKDEPVYHRKCNRSMVG